MVRALGILLGLILIAPGLCSLGLMGTLVVEYVHASGPVRSQDLGLLVPLGLVWAVCIAISFAGIGMIRRGLSRAPIDTPEVSGDLYATKPRLIVRILGWSLLAFLVSGFVVGLMQGLLR